MDKTAFRNAKKLYGSKGWGDSLPQYLPKPEQSEIFLQAVLQEAGTLWNNRKVINVENISLGLNEGIQSGCYPEWIKNVEPDDLNNIVLAMQERSFFMPEPKRPILLGSALSTTVPAVLQDPKKIQKKLEERMLAYKQRTNFDQNISHIPSL